MRYVVCEQCGSSRAIGTSDDYRLMVVSAGTNVGACAACSGRTRGGGWPARAHKYVVESDDHDLTKLHALAKLFASTYRERPDGTA